MTRELLYWRAGTCLLMGFSLVLEKRRLGLKALERMLAGLADLRTREHGTGRLGDHWETKTLLGDWEAVRLKDGETGRLRHWDTARLADWKIGRLGAS